MQIMTVNAQSSFCRLSAVRLAVVVGLLALGLSFLPAAQSYPIYRAKPAKATALPAWQIAGAVKLKKTDIKTVQNKKKTVTSVCGKVNKRWWPGTILTAGPKKGWFLKLNTETANLRKRSTFVGASGDAKKQKELLTLSRQKHREYVSRVGLCRAAGGSGSGSGSATPLRFNFSGAVGVTVGSAASRKGRPSTRQSSGGIKAVLANGALRDAITSGTVTTNKIAISPSGTIVIAFQNKVNLDNAATAYAINGCLIVTVDRGSGIPACIDSSLSHLSSSNGYEAIQFDEAGGIYYSGGVASSNGSGMVLRRYKNGVITDLVTGQISLNAFLVAPNGIVLIQGYTIATQTWWNRRLSPTGEIQNLGPPAPSNGATVNFRLFADGNVYMGHSRSLSRFLTSSSQMDPTYWISGSGYGNSSSATYDWDVYCSLSGGGNGTGPCASNNMTWDSLTAQTTTSKNFITGTNGVIQAYPTLATYTTPLAITSIMKASGTTLLLAGTSSASENLLVKFDTTTNTPTTIASRSSASGEIEFYHVEPSSDGYALFDGLRFSDNTYVIGKINYNTGDVTILSTTTGKIDDFKAF